MIKEFNKIRGASCFYNNISPMIAQANFAVMNSSYLQHFSGNLVCADINCAEIALRAQTNYKIFLYLWDVFFVRGSSDYIYNTEIIRNSNVSLICRSESHKSVILNYCGVDPVAIIDNWDASLLKGLLWTKK